ncbi:MAG TPA: LuxR C-terminal-related transcriptional regulator [Nocardioidaceae bacterium]|nr:LuxR C-terminal-related transcriptional regulator [Nocardioidaceae bacterium]
MSFDIEETSVRESAVERGRKAASTLDAILAGVTVGRHHKDSDEVRAAAARSDESGSLEALADLFDAVDRARTMVAREIADQPLLAARRINVALERLQSVTSLDDLVRAVPTEACWAGDFDRCLFSRVEASTWIPTSWFTSHPESEATARFGEFVRTARVALSSGMIEAEIVRRKVTALVTDAAHELRTFRPIVDIARSPAYVVAPVVSGGQVVGMLHADTGVSGRPLVEADRISLRAIADGVSLILERLALVERLGQQRRQIHEAFAAAERAVDELCTAPVSLSLGPADVETLPIRDALPEDGLTTREREVFALVVKGATNAEIADRLTVSETTVKSHVKHILRKLRASNRAEAIAKYLRSSGRMGDLR